MASIEMTEFDRPEIEVRPEVETNIDFPDVPVDQTGSLSELQANVRIEQMVDSIRKQLRLGITVDKRVYRKLTVDNEGYLYYDNKRLTSKRGNKLGLLSINTLQKSAEGREFLQMIGYDTDVTKPKTIATDVVRSRQSERDLGTVAPEQVAALKAKIDSFKVTEQWAKNEKEKAIKQLGTTTGDAEKQTLTESIQYFEQMEQQAKRRYNEMTSNQIKRLNEIISDKTRPVGERLKELFRRDGLTIGAVITAIGMVVSTIVLTIKLQLGVSPLPSPTPSPPPTPNKAKIILVKVANWLLDMAKKAAAAIPGLIGTLIGFLFKKAGQAVLFLSEHLVLLLLTILLAATEFFIMRRRRRQ